MHANSTLVVDRFVASATSYGGKALMDMDLASARIFLPTLVSLCALYPLLAARFATARQTAWILTTIASGLMTAAALPFLADYIKARGDVGAVLLRADVACAVNRFFQAYLTADLLVGALAYRAQVGLLTGWVHHAVYLGITEIAIRNGWAHIFCMCAIMELPTFLLGASTLFPRLRSNTLFAATFLATRIVLHLVLIISYVLFPVAPLPASSVFSAADGGYAAAPILSPAGVLGAALRAVGAVRGTRVVSALLAFVFPLHAMWFVGCVKGFIRRARASSTSSASLTAKDTTRPALAPDIYPDARSLARHARAPPPPTRWLAAASPWAITASPWTALQVGRLRRLRARVSTLVQNRAQGVRPIRPRAMARRVSESLIAALPGAGGVVGYVMGR